MQRSLGAAGIIAAPNSACRSSVDERPSACTFSAAWQRLLPNEISGFWAACPAHRPCADERHRIVELRGAANLRRKMI